MEREVSKLVVQMKSWVLPFTFQWSLFAPLALLLLLRAHLGGCFGTNSHWFLLCLAMNPFLLGIHPSFLPAGGNCG